MDGHGTWESRADTDGGKTRTRRLEYDRNNLIMSSSIYGSWMHERRYVSKLMNERRTIKNTMRRV